MDGTVTMQDPNVKCGSCNHFGESCANTNPNSQVGDCNEYEPIKSYGWPGICRSCANINETCVPENDNCCSGYKAITNEPKPFICDTCGYKGGCGHVPNRDGSCLYGPVPVELHGSKDVEAIYKEALQALKNYPNKPSTDAVNHPSHYTQGGIECIKAIEASMPPDGFQDYCKGNVLKYVWRFRQKNGLEDLKKARVYLNWMIESVEKGCGDAST